MKNILAAIDFTDVSNEIVEKGAELAKALDAKLWVVHVAPPVSTQLDMNIVSYDLPGLNSVGNSFYSELLNIDEARKTVASRLKDEHNYMLDLAKRYNEQGIDVNSLLLEGSEVDRILEKAEQKKVDLILMGSHGHGLLHKAIIGSISEGVIKRSKVPVMLIPQK